MQFQGSKDEGQGSETRKWGGKSEVMQEQASNSPHPKRELISKSLDMSEEAM